MDKKINLETLNDFQKIWLSDLAYVDLKEDGYKKILEQGLTLEEAREYIKNPTLPVTGDMFLGTKNFNFFAEKILGNDNYPSKVDVIDVLIKSGLGDLKIIHTSDYPTLYPSGFQALTFEDSYGNIGISYRGSDMLFTSSVLREWIQSNFLEFFSNNSQQAKEAIQYFSEHKTEDKNNYIYGHSLGGNLVSHVYLKYYKNIKQAFSINGTPINQKLIDTDDRIAAFNNKNKFSFNVVCGDVVSQLKSCEVYKDNVNYIKNNNTMEQSFLSAHMIQAASFDENGNFIKISAKEMLEKTKIISLKMINLARFTRENIDKFVYKINKSAKYKNIITIEQTNIDENKIK